MSAGAGRGPAAAGLIPIPALTHAPAAEVSRAPALANALLGQLDTEHPALSGSPDRERLLAAAWLAGYRSPRTRRAYAADLAAWLDWLTGLDVDVLDARRVHVDLWARHLLDSGAAASSTTRRLSAVTSFYHHLVDHDLLAANPAASVRRPKVDADHTTTVGLDRDQARAFLAAADADLGPARLRTAATARLLLHLGLRVDELAAADVADLGYDRGHRVLTVVRKGGRRATLPIPPATGAALDVYLAARPPGPDGGPPAGPLLATASGARLDQSALCKLVRRLARAAEVPQWSELSPHSLRHTAITLALDAGAPLRDVQDYAGHRDPRTTRRYDRSRGSLDRNAAYTLTAYLS
ncbi:tyrosine-type recombinase/integrase [Pseudonocardia oceani]|nr:tyrosine-type recombinase/integrase [Pseudonocardia oceani]